jgi:hypothetical protein
MGPDGANGDAAGLQRLPLRCPCLVVSLASLTPSRREVGPINQ